MAFVPLCRRRDGGGVDAGEPAARLRALVSLVVGVALMVALCTHPAEAGATATAPPCATSGLVVWLDTRGDGAAGSTYFFLRFTNLSGHACTLVGYPGVSAVGLHGQRLGSAAGRNPQTTRRTVRLAAGGRASALLQIANVANFPRATCRPGTAAGLRVYPPNQTGSKLIPFPFPACLRAGPTYLHVAVAS